MADVLRDAIKSLEDEGIRVKDLLACTTYLFRRCGGCSACIAFGRLSAALSVVPEKEVMPTDPVTDAKLVHGTAVTQPGVESGSGHECAATKALRDLLTAVKANPAMQGREYVGLGIQVNEALSHPCHPEKGEDKRLLEYWYAHQDLYFVKHEDGTVALHTNDHDFMQDPEVSRGNTFRDALRAAIAEEARTEQPGVRRAE